ncbi:nucleoside-diphosphate kinase [Clostridium sp. SHJSY1]|uniref:nucleoside-diphosphate kinase n=1 Tax=Clostridium sp. SHJSY1 TaxID=2942483 RepID=UPI0037BFC91E
MQRSLVLIKPDGVERNIIGKVINFYEEDGLKIVALKMEWATEEIAMKHYEQHKGKFFYQELIEYITRSPLCALIVEGEEAIEKVRKINGSTNPIKAEKGTIRNLYAKSVTENCVHASDSVESAEREISIWFNNK